MKLLQRYLRAEIGGHALLGLGVFTFVILMGQVGRLLEASVRANSFSVLAIFAYALPSALVFTLPTAVLVGTLIGLGRLGVDNELLALRVAGVSGWRIMAPLLRLAAMATGLALVFTLWLAPAANQRMNAMETRIASSQLTAGVQPRVFWEPNASWVVYVGDIVDGGQEWRQVFIADMHDPKYAPQVTLARRGQLVALAGGAVQIHLDNGAYYQVSNQNPEHSIVNRFASTDIPVDLDRPAAGLPPLSTLGPAELWQRARFGADWQAARVEWSRRFALAASCLALAGLGIALGLAGGRGGKSGGFVLTIILVFGYYLAFILGLGLAREGRIPPWLGAWGANLLFFAAGAIALARVERLRRRPPLGLDPVAWVRALLARRTQRLRAAHPERVGRPDWTPSLLLEGYIVRSFLGYTALLLGAFLMLVLVFTVFELVGSILQNHIGLGVVVPYLLYLSPQMLYATSPVAILLGVLITFGLMSKSNEITALKASGVSVYRLLVPVLIAAAALAGAQFALDSTWLPGFNRKQDALRAQIKGQPAQTYYHPEHKWVFGQGNDIYYFTSFDPGRQEIVDVSLFEFDPVSFALTRRIFAGEARWNPDIGHWVFTNGWQRNLNPDGTESFQRFSVADFDEAREPPSYFASDTLQGSQMTYTELRDYVASLRKSGYDVARLSVQLDKKVAYPLITVVMAMLAFPFALSVGRRGTISGVTLGIGIAMAYWVASGLLEALGNLGQMPPFLAAWTPDLIFMIASVYLLLRVPT